jgi:hypothetical protein
MNATLSARLATIAAGIQRAVDTGARLSPSDAARLHEALLTCAALARSIEAERERGACLARALAPALGMAESVA